MTLSKFTSVNYEHAITFENNIRNRDFKNLAKWTHLTHLKIVSDRISEATFERYLGRFKQLQMLDLRGCTRISDAKVVSLARTLPNLKECGLPSQKDGFPIAESITDDYMRAFSKNTSQKLLKIQSSFITAVSLTYVENMTGLEMIDLRGCTKISDTEAIELTQVLPKLQAIGLPTQKEIKHLTELTNDDCRSLTQNIYLRSLKVASKALTDNALIHVASMQELRILDLRGSTNMSDEKVLHLIRLRLLQNLEKCGLPHQKHIKLITELTNDILQVTDADIQFISQSTHSTSLKIESRLITNASLEYIEKMQHLRTLDLRGCTQISDEEVLKLITRMPYLKECGLPNSRELQRIECSSEIDLLCHQMQQLRLKPSIMPRLEDFQLLNSTEKPRSRYFFSKS